MLGQWVAAPELAQSCRSQIVNVRAGGMVEMVSDSGWSGTRHYMGCERLGIEADGGGRGGRMGCTPRV
jgi:hypothetical protein